VALGFEDWPEPSANAPQRQEAEQAEVGKWMKRSWATFCSSMALCSSSGA
jgi:hypothetical protein